MRRGMVGFQNGPTAIGRKKTVGQLKQCSVYRSVTQLVCEPLEITVILAYRNTYLFTSWPFVKPWKTTGH